MSQLAQRLQRVAETLDSTVAPALADEHVRGQLAAVVALLVDLARKADWSPEYLSELRTAQQALIEDLAPIFAAAGAMLPVELSAPEIPSPSGQALKTRIEDFDRAVCELLKDVDRGGYAFGGHLKPALHTYLSRLTRIEVRFSHNPPLHDITKNARG